MAEDIALETIFVIAEGAACILLTAHDFLSVQTAWYHGCTYFLRTNVHDKILGS